MRVSVVDDHALFSDGLEAWLRASAPDVTVVLATADVDVALNRVGDTDVVLLDVDLGPESPPLSSSVSRFRSAGVGVLVVSALGNARLVRQALGAGALGYVSKREPGDVLLEALRTVARGEPYLTPELAGILTEDRDEVPALSDQEVRVLRLYASGLKLDTVARRLGISSGTAREYLERVKRKYGEVGRPARTKTELLHVASEDGILPVPGYHPPKDEGPA